MTVISIFPNYPVLIPPGISAVHLGGNIQSNRGFMSGSIRSGNLGAAAIGGPSRGRGQRFGHGLTPHGGIDPGGIDRARLSCACGLESARITPNQSDSGQRTPVNWFRM